MPYLTDTADPGPPPATAKAPPRSWGESSRITPGFNVALFTLAAVLGIFPFLVTSEAARGVPWMGLAVSIALDTLRFAVVLLITAVFVREFWKRLIASLFAIRPINYQEAIAIVLMLSVLSLG